MGKGRNEAGSGIQWEPEVEPLRVFRSGFQNPLGTGFKTLCYGSQGLKPCGERVFVQFRVLNPKGFALPAKPLGFFRCVSVDDLVGHDEIDLGSSLLQ